ncbi:hypothetical protein MBLNU230_g3848t1 [Neophaeotheca triangularis]
MYPRQPPKQAKNYEADPLWNRKLFTPAQLLVNDIRLETFRPQGGPLLEVVERLPSDLVPSTAALTPSSGIIRASEAARNPIERQRFTELEEQYGWLKHLRLQSYQQHQSDSEHAAKVRWIHCSFKDPEYIQGFLFALSGDLSTISESMRMLHHAVQRHTRFSKHGDCFAPFFQLLRSDAHDGTDQYPMLLSVPFLDWTTEGEPPPLRFQADKREGHVRQKLHPIRSVLQHHYRLEDTSDREKSQVFTKHRPWTTNREMDLKTRQWYGQYPSSLNVDELWVLAIDEQHCVTFSTNQTWKSIWPPFQLPARISDVSFRDMRNNFYSSSDKREYTAMTHVLTSLSGAVGITMRNFWPDLTFSITDRYAGYLEHLQYRLHRSPSTKLVMDLISCQEELSIVIGITQRQIDMITELQLALSAWAATRTVPEAAALPHSRRPSSSTNNRHQAVHRQMSSSPLTDPIARLLDNLQRELVDLSELRDNTDKQVTRTIQLVNIRLEDHGKAIIIFTIVTIVFLPLNFVTSFFGMNFSDIRDMAQTQSLFWAVAVSVTAVVVGGSMFLAFYGGDLVEKVVIWRDSRRERRGKSPLTLKRSNRRVGGSRAKTDSKSLC